MSAVRLTGDDWRADVSYIVDDICRRLARRRTFALPGSRSRCRPTRITNSPANQDRQATLFEAVGNLLSRWHAGATLVFLDDLQSVDGATALDRRRGPGGAVCMYEACIQRARAAAVAEFRRGAVCP
jgi:hypothetical protein